MPLLTLTPEEHTALEHRRDTAEKPYERERAAALLKVAAGLSVTWVARHGLLRPRKRTTVYTWVRRFRKEGFASLSIRPGRGRKPAFSPGLPTSGGSQSRPAARGPTGPPPLGL